MKYRFQIKLLSALRKGRGMTQAEVARKLGIPKQQYHRWESGFVPTVRYLEKICDVLDVSPSLFFVPELHHNSEGGIESHNDKGKRRRFLPSA